MAAIVAALALLVACDSAEERAEKHFQNGMRLLQEGDVDRALVELRNVFTLDKNNLEARIAYADAARSVGNIPEAYTNYLRVVEQTPDNHEARLALVQMAIEAQNWEEAERHGAALVEANVEIEGTQAAKLALEFRKAVLDDDSSRIRDLTREAETLYETRREDPILQRMLIEGYSRDGDIDAALEVADVALATFPENQQLYLVKAQLLDRKGDPEAVEQHLREMVRRFPEEDRTKSILIRQLASRGELDEAEAFLREELEASDAPRDSHVTLVTFLQQTRGDEAALAELDSAIETYDDPRLFRALRAGILFDTGNAEAAVTEMQAVVDSSEPGDETDRYKVTLAKMLLVVGNEVGARQLVEDVLSTDPGQVSALKMAARWSIDADDPEGALRQLRLAMDRDPEDAEAMTLMAEAHQRSGNPELAQDLLALAVEASGNAPAESIRFASLLTDQERYRPAEDVLVRALRVSPGNPQVLELLGRIHLATEDWARAAQVEETLRRQETPQTTRAADALQLQIVARQEGRDSAIAFLEGLNSEDSGNAAATIALIQARLAENDAEGALELASKLAEEYPDNPRAKMVLVNTLFALKDFEAAERVARETLQAGPNADASLQLLRILGAQGRVDDARATLDAALQATPEDENLLWVQASLLERENDFDGAISVYERLYERDTGSLIVANNLASLLATYRQDDESLQRAFNVARRLNGTEVAPFQDTYGWILYRRGEHGEALTYLEPAARALENDPIVQYHLGKVYEALGRTEDAAEAFARAVEIAPGDDPRRQIAEARDFVEGFSDQSGDQ